MALTQRSALEDLLRDLFDADELRAFLRRCDHGATLEASLPLGAVTPAALVSHAVGALIRRGEVDAPFFDALVRERPKRIARIEVVRQMWIAAAWN